MVDSLTPNLDPVRLMAFYLKVVTVVTAGGGLGQWGLLNKAIQFGVRQTGD